MKKSLKGTKTADNLLKAFAGESQARNRYTMYASVAKKEGYEQISAIFLETAENERVHAKRFFEFLADDFEGEMRHLEADYPVGLGTTEDNLKYAAEGEHDEWSDLYPAFAEVAKEEGFTAIAAAFRYISVSEKHHEERYLKLLENVKEYEVFKKDGEVYWRCRKCGYVYKGKEAPKKCPACDHPQAYFELLCDNF
ncbi:rubrerythrin [Vagococcus humatus]|uniref:Rubrerythrin family protein n=1 Tax=Vagococcus humatus TaxID=1889241 RepID=A0A3R9YIU4_9ENTE|nr:rubrerythrin family protein [Vagococcus humatus]RST88713.1 rubrerythrin family protein [Vagococcus humatus]